MLVYHVAVAGGNQGEGRGALLVAVAALHVPTMP